MNFDAATFFQEFLGNTACRNTNSRFTGRRAATTTVIPRAVFLMIGVIRMTGTETVFDIGIVTTALIGILDQQANAGTGGFTFKHTR